MSVSPVTLQRLQEGRDSVALLGCLLVWGSQLCSPSADTLWILLFLFASLPALHMPDHDLAHHPVHVSSRNLSLILSFR